MEVVITREGQWHLNQERRQGCRRALPNDLAPVPCWALSFAPQFRINFETLFSLFLYDKDFSKEGGP